MQHIKSCKAKTNEWGKICLKMSIVLSILDTWYAFREGQVNLITRFHSPFKIKLGGRVGEFYFLFLPHRYFLQTTL